MLCMTSLSTYLSKTVKYSAKDGSANIQIFTNHKTHNITEYGNRRGLKRTWKVEVGGMDVVQVSAASSSTYRLRNHHIRY